MTTTIWQVDDTPDWHYVTDATLRQYQDSEITIEHFHTGEAALLAWHHACQSDTLPDIVLMDFYLGSTRGDQVAQTMINQLPEHHYCNIIGHSTVADCSSRIRYITKGDIIRKHANSAGINPSLLQWLNERK